MRYSSSYILCLRFWSWWACGTICFGDLTGDLVMRRGFTLHVRFGGLIYLQEWEVSGAQLEAVDGQRTS